MTKEIFTTGNDCTMILDPASASWVSTDNTSQTVLMWNDFSNQINLTTFAIPIDLTRGSGANQIPVGATITDVKFKAYINDYSFSDVGDYWDIWQYAGDTANRPASGGNAAVAGYKDASTSVGYDGATLLDRSTFDDVHDYWDPMFGGPKTISLSDVNLTGPNTIFGSLDINFGGSAPGDYYRFRSSKYYETNIADPGYHIAQYYAPRYVVTYTIPSTTGASQSQLLMGK